MTCPWCGLDFSTVQALLTDVAGHLGAPKDPDSRSAKLLEEWRKSSASRASTTRTHEILALILAALLENVDVVTNVTEGTAALQEIAATVPAQVVESQEDRDAIRARLLAVDGEIAALTERATAAEERATALEERIAALEEPPVPEPTDGGA